jgi:hypothetical protein
MHIDTLREELHRQPFRPFHLRLVDGRRLPVPHPDFVAVSPRRVVVISPADESVQTDTMRVVRREQFKGCMPLASAFVCAVIPLCELTCEADLESRIIEPIIAASHSLEHGEVSRPKKQPRKGPSP